MTNQIKIKERKIIITKQQISNAHFNQNANQCILQNYNLVLFYSISCGKLIRNLPIEQSALPGNSYFKNLVIQKQYESNLLKFYDVTTAKLFKTLKKKNKKVLSIIMNLQQSLLAISDLETKIKIWDFKRGVLIANYEQLIGYPNDLIFNTSETILYSYSYQFAQGFDIKKREIVWKLQLDAQSPYIHIDQFGKYCLSTQNYIDHLTSQTSFQLEDLQTGYIKKFSQDQRIIQGFSISNSEKYIMVIAGQNLQIYEIISNELVLELEFVFKIFRASFCHNCDLILVTNEYSEIKFYNIKGEDVHVIKEVENFWVHLNQQIFITYSKRQCRILY